MLSVEQRQEIRKRMEAMPGPFAVDDPAFADTPEAVFASHSLHDVLMLLRHADWADAQLAKAGAEVRLLRGLLADVAQDGHPVAAALRCREALVKIVAMCVAAWEADATWPALNDAAERIEELARETLEGKP